MRLTPEQVALFRHNGFVKLPGRLPDETVAALKASIWQQVEAEVAPVVRDKQGRVVRLSKIWERGSPFREALTCPQVLDPLEALLGPNIELVTNRHNHTTLRLAEDNVDYFHRDVLQWSRTIVTVLFYLEDSTVENGCTWVVPGTHLLAGRKTINLTQDEELKRAGLFEQAVPVPMPAGGLLAIDSMILHTAGKNTTPGTRLSMTAGYHSADELSPVENPKRVLVRGERIYMGNDNY
ncbi:MAG TPA: phytanoyl-CoA dioxygenase family protein [Chthonomonadaceae bacterium]|nr:phytanoyl-CoA dioxygenase family protein [Chthonomonadaceae bacterium]